MYWIGYQEQIYIFDIINQKTKIIQELSNKAMQYKNMVVIDQTLHLTKSHLPKTRYDHGESTHFVCSIYDDDKEIRITDANETDINIDYLGPRNKYGYKDIENVYIKSKNIIVAIGCVPYTFSRGWWE